MKTLRARWLAASLLGVLMYASVRLLNDTVSGTRFWRRPWGLTLLEVSLGVAVAYGLLAGLRWQLRRVGRRPAAAPQPLREGLAVAALTLLVLNLTFTPLAAFTDDGLSSGDLAAINLVPLLYMLGCYGWLRSRQYWRAALTQQAQLARARQANTLTELNFLRAQYHPHFLFNALNTVYFQMDEDVPAAKHSLEQLAELLRYQLYDQQQPVRMAQELRYLRGYLALQRVRHSEQLQLSVAIAPALHAQRLYPLLLLPLLENAFKYAGSRGSIWVQASCVAQELVFEVRNTVATGGPPAAAPGGLGLGNLRRRLALLYPGRHTLRAEPAGPYFVAHLTLALLDP